MTISEIDARLQKIWKEYELEPEFKERGLLIHLGKVMNIKKIHWRLAQGADLEVILTFLMRTVTASS